MSKYYYRGINIGKETEDIYNAYTINRITQLSNFIINENAIKKLKEKNLKFCFSTFIPISQQNILVCEIRSNKTPLFGIYNKINKCFIDVLSSYIVTITDNQMTLLASTFSKLIFYYQEKLYYSDLPEAIQNQWKEYKKYMSQFDSIDHIIDGNYVNKNKKDHILNEYDFEKAIEKNNRKENLNYKYNDQNDIDYDEEIDL